MCFQSNSQSITVAVLILTCRIKCSYNRVHRWKLTELEFRSGCSRHVSGRLKWMHRTHQHRLSVVSTSVQSLSTSQIRCKQWQMFKSSNEQFKTAWIPSHQTTLSALGIKPSDTTCAVTTTLQLLSLYQSKACWMRFKCWVYGWQSTRWSCCFCWWWLNVHIPVDV